MCGCEFCAMCAVKNLVIACIISKGKLQQVFISRGVILSGRSLQRWGYLLRNQVLNCLLSGEISIDKELSGIPHAKVFCCHSEEQCCICFGIL